MKLKIIRGVQGKHGEQAIKEHFLKADKDNIIGRSMQNKTWIPDIDLLPDYSVSRRHARLVFKDDAWNIIDLSSRHGTLVGDVKLGKTDPPIVVAPGVPIEIGRTILLMDPVGRHRAPWQDLSIAFDFPTSINYSLFHCGLPTLRNISVLNVGDEPSKPFLLCFQVPGYSKECTIDVPLIPPRKSHFVKEVLFTLHQERLEEVSERVRASFEFKAARDRNELQAVKEATYHADIWVLGFHEWSEKIEHRKTLAAFVQPGNPVVQAIISRAERQLKKIAGISSFSDLKFRDNSTELVLKGLYECLRRSYDIKYDDPPVSYELKSQVIRPPHRIITGLKGKKPSGNGTCVDVTLLMAACLEFLALHPLIIVVRENDWTQHAFAGCWKGFNAISDSVLSYDQLNSAVSNEKVLLLECTGFAEDRGKKLTYNESVKAALEEFSAEKFLYALNIVQLRQEPYRITSIENQRSPEALKIIRLSEDIARSEDSQLVHAVHLLYGFLTAGTEISSRVLENFSFKDVVKKNSNEKPLKQSQGFIGVINAAKDLARRSESSHMEEHHLLWALLSCGRKKLSTELKKYGLNIGELQKNLDRVLEEKKIKINPPDDSYCVKDDIRADDKNEGVS